MSIVKPAITRTSEASQHAQTVNQITGSHIPVTVEPILKDHLIDHKNVICQDGWSLVTASVILNGSSFCWKCVVCQDRWSLKIAFTVLGLSITFTTLCQIISLYTSMWSYVAPTHVQWPGVYHQSQITCFTRFYWLLCYRSILYKYQADKNLMSGVTCVR